jgi:Zn-dependent protease with chaperone function
LQEKGYLLWRAALAVALMGAFHGLALAAAAALLATPLLLARVSWGLAFKSALFCLIGAFLILKAIFPRRDRFEPPGPRLDRETQPRPFAEIGAVAAATRQAPPAEVYLVPDVNAFVGQRGGVMGVGSRRVMGIGLPLLQVLTVRELRAVLAHEFGHFDGGDVAIGPWIYSTRAALLRTLEDLREHSEALTVPFQWYAALFFRATHAVSRHQEVKADRLAARVAEAGPLASGLRVTHDTAFAFWAYWSGAVGPLLEAGFLPPLAAGFETFLKAPWLDEAQKHLASEEKPSPFDTHPPLAARLAALGLGDRREERDDGPLALSLVEGGPTLERRLAEFVTKRADAAAPSETGGLRLARDRPSLIPIGWEEVGTRVWLPEWERHARRHRRVLEGVTPALLPGLDWQRVGRRLVAGEPDGEPLRAADSVVGVALGVVLARAGFAVESTPGVNVALLGFAERVEPFGLRERLSTGPNAVEAWQALCARAGIADVDLGRLG